MNEKTGESQPLPPRPNRRPPRPRRRGGRRGPPSGREQSPQPVGIAAAQTEPLSGQPVLEPANREQPIRVSPSVHPRSQPPQQQKRAGSPIVQAVEQIEEIIKTLRESLRELEEVLEMLDDAQRQQIGDEKEIELLRRALSSLQRERQSPIREPSRSRPDDRGRSENRPRPDEQNPTTDSSE